jgi:hypothetical protein
MSSAKMVNLASRSTILENPKFVDLGCLDTFWWSGGIFGESRAMNLDQIGRISFPHYFTPSFYASPAR